MPILNQENEADCKRFDRFMKEHSHSSYTQCLDWSKVKANWKHEAIFVENDDGIIVGAALLLIREAPLVKRSILYAPRGPVWDWDDIETFHQLMLMMAIIAKRYHAYKIIVDPYFKENDQKQIDFLQSFGFDFTPKTPPLTTIQSRTTYVLNLTGKTAEEVFENFHSKWRYNIRLASRKGVECRVCTTEEALNDFYALMVKTGERDGFIPRSQAYFDTFINALGNSCRLYMCYHEGTPLSGAITTNFAGRTFYVYGASSNENRNLMPNYLMQWSMIQWAIETGCDLYDFGGIAFYEDETHRNHGVYKFKKGFNGEINIYAGEFTQVLDAKIDKMEKLFKKAKKLLRK